MSEPIIRPPQGDDGLARISPQALREIVRMAIGAGWQVYGLCQGEACGRCGEPLPHLELTEPQLDHIERQVVASLQMAARAQHTGLYGPDGQALMKG